MEEILIEKVRQYEVLYNHSSRDYRDQRIRQEAWEEIGYELKITAEKAKQMWDKLRRCYSNARNRRLSAKNGHAAKSKLKWKFEQPMSFLLPYLEGRRTYRNLIPDIQDNADAQQSQANADDGVPVPDAIWEQESQFGKNEYTSQEVDTGLDTVKKRKQCCKPNSAAELVPIVQNNPDLRKRKYENQEEAAEAKNSSPLENMDDIDLFFLSMAKMTKRLPQYEQTTVKLAVSNAVLQAEQRSFERPPYYCPQTTSVPPPLSSALSSTIQPACSPQYYLGHESDCSSNFKNEN